MHAIVTHILKLAHYYCQNGREMPFYTSHLVLFQIPNTDGSVGITSSDLLAIWGHGQDGNLAMLLDVNGTVDHGRDALAGFQVPYNDAVTTWFDKTPIKCTFEP